MMYDDFSLYVNNMYNTIACLQVSVFVFYTALCKLPWTKSRSSGSDLIVHHEKNIYVKPAVVPTGRNM